MNYKFKTKPYAHQITALEKSWNKEEYAYFMEMGTGKSKVLVDNIAMLYDKGKINAALIIAPKGVYRNWFSGEIPTHLPSHVNHKKVLWTATTSKTKDKEYQQLFKVDYDLHILVMNVEAFSTKKGLEFAHKFLNCHEALMAIDESTSIKTPTAKRTKSILTIGKLAKYRRILTGSPVTKSPLDLYTQCGFLHVELTDEQQKAYSTMKSAALASLKGKMATAPHVLTQLMRLHQITCGHLKNDDDSITEIKNNRIASLLELLEEVEGKVIIWANYVYDIKQIVAAISKKYGEDSIVQYYGAIEADVRQNNIEKFQDPDSPARFFVGNPQTGGYGITLTAANNVVYYSNGYDLEKRLQSEDRAHRIGQKKAVTYVDLIAPKTVDEKIRTALRKKINIATEVMGEELRDWI